MGLGEAAYWVMVQMLLLGCMALAAVVLIWGGLLAWHAARFGYRIAQRFGWVE